VSLTQLALSRNQFRSRVVRELAGDRTIDIFASLTQKDETGGIIGTFVGFAAKLAGFAIQAIVGGLKWLLRNLWEILVEAYFEVKNFNWNSTDAEVKKQIEQNETQIFAALGNLAGTGLVWTVGVVVAAGLTIKFPVLAGSVALKLAEEGGEEIRANIVNLIQTARNITVRNMILGGFLSARRLRLFGLAPVTTQKEPWTIAEAIDEKVEDIKDDKLRLFVENFLESFEESLIEMGYVVTYAIEDFYASQKLANRSLFGEEKTVQIIPDKRAEDEAILMSGGQHLLQQNIELALANHKLIYNRDVGQIVGQPAPDWARGTFQRRKMTIVFKSKEKPPWVSATETVREYTCTIPDVKTGLTWKEIKQAANPYTWGKFAAVGHFDNNRSMVVHGATKEQAERKFRELAALSTASLLTLNVAEEVERNPKLKKQATSIYPAYANLLIRRPTTELAGRTDLDGNNWEQEHPRIDLWTSEEPEFMPVLG